jgi:ABC-type antimicrobial peptide transport system permease subunit
LFGGLALALAAIGLYGLMSYGVVRRTREFGIRIAIGARAGSIVGLVVGEALWLLVAGTAIGLIAAWVLGRVVKAMLFGIEPSDPVSTVFAILVLAVAALFAAWIPARRAGRVDPMRALRWD